MSEYPLRNLITGNRIIRLPSCDSTNSEALCLLTTSNVSEGTIVITDEQTAGRGQREGNWVSSPGKDLTFSVILKPSFLHVNDRFYLIMIVSLALFELLFDLIGEALRIKWPNDIMAGDKKIGGILIETGIKRDFFSSAVIGIGINVNSDDQGIENASSLKLVTGQLTATDRLLAQFCKLFDKYYLQLRAGERDKIYSEYINVLYRLNTLRLFRSTDGIFEGIIKGVDAIGRLKVETGGVIKSFNLKEIQFIE